VKETFAWLLAGSALIFPFSCSCPSGSPSDAGTDASGPRDAGPLDGGEPDASSADGGSPDGGGSDAANPDAGGLDASSLSFAPHNEWHDACLAINACGLAPSGTDVSSCNNAEPQPGQIPTLYDDAQIACAFDAAMDCSAIAICLDDGNPSPSCSASSTPSCLGTLLSTCVAPAGSQEAMDCASFGLQCTSGGSGAACGLGTCTINGATGCLQGRAVACSQGIWQVTEDCTAFQGTTCVADGGYCQASGSACTADSCSGTVVNACKGGHTTSFDCAPRQLICVISGGKAECDLGTTCSADNSDGCADLSTLDTCNAGLPEQINCDSVGYTGGCGIGPDNSWGVCLPP
jgi:hypothetical protein